MSIDLNTTRATLEPMQRWMPSPKLKCRLFLRPRSSRCGSGNTAGSRLAIAQDSQRRSPSLNCVPASLRSAAIVRPSPGAGVK